MTDKEKIKSIIELFIAWNGEKEVIDIANLDSAVDFIIDSLSEEPVSEELLDTTQTITYNGEVYIRRYKDELDAFACKYPMSVPKTSKKYAKYSDVDLTIAVKAGAKWQAEKDLELSWEDIPEIFRISEQLKTSWWFMDRTKEIGTQAFWEEVLKRFKAQKGK